MTFWHKAQRRWPFIRVERPLTEVPRVVWIIADAPDVSGDKYGVKVELDGIKQGQYNSQPACFLKFTVENGIINESSDTCYYFQLCPANDVALQNPSCSPRPFIAAYGPAHVTDTELPATPFHADDFRPASVIAYPQNDGLLLVVRRSSVGRHAVAHSFFFAMIVVHSKDVVLKVIPSISDWRRALVLQRSRVRPVLLDSNAEPGEWMTTCALQEEGGCHPTCDDLGPGHLTLDLWKGFIVKDEVKHYDGDSPPNEWVHYAAEGVAEQAFTGGEGGGGGGGAPCREM